MLRQLAANIWVSRTSLPQIVSLNARSLTPSTLTALFNFRLQDLILCRRPLSRRSIRLRIHFNHNERPIFGVISTIEVTDLVPVSTSPQVAVA